MPRVGGVRHNFARGCLRIVQTLGEILRDMERGKIALDSSQEDIHMAIENELTARIGETGGKLHTARSRNDQVALDMRLYMRDMIPGRWTLCAECNRPWSKWLKRTST